MNYFLVCENVLVFRNKNLSKRTGLLLRFRETHVLSHGRSEYFAFVFSAPVAPMFYLKNKLLKPSEWVLPFLAVIRRE